MKVTLNLDEETYHRFQELYGRSIGVSKAVRILMEKQLKIMKDQNNVGDNSPREHVKPTDEQEPS